MELASFLRLHCNHSSSPSSFIHWVLLILINSFLLSPSITRLDSTAMGKIPSFKDEFTFDQRLEESRDIIVKYPNRLPVIVERYSKADLPEMEKKKYLVPRDMSVGQFIHILSLRLRLTPGKALFVFVKNALPQTATPMDTVYESFEEDDGFLYVLQQ